MTIKHKNNLYYKEFTQTNPSLVIGLIIISFGLYIITWLYVRNKEFELLDKHAPNSIRGTVIMVLLPACWFYITFLFKELILDNIIIEMIELTGWFLVLLLVLKYIFDFCLSFGRITGTNGVYWSLIFLVPFLAIPAMQSELNSHFNRMTIRKKSNNFYS